MVRSRPAPRCAQRRNAARRLGPARGSERDDEVRVVLLHVVAADHRVLQVARVHVEVADDADAVPGDGGLVAGLRFADRVLRGKRGRDVRGISARQRRGGAATRPRTHPRREEPAGSRDGLARGAARPTADRPTARRARLEGPRTVPRVPRRRLGVAAALYRRVALPPRRGVFRCRRS